MVPHPVTRVLDRLVEPQYRRDFLAFTGDIFFFSVALSLVSRSTVLPALVRRLTGSAPLVGLVETIANGAWLLPQLVAARFLFTRSARRRYVVRAVLVQRIAFLAAAPLLLVLAPTQPMWAAVVVFVMLGLFFGLDAFASVAWFDLLSLAVPPVPRGRLIGLSQLLSGLAGMGCGYVVSLVLGSEHLGWVRGYSLLFGLSGLSFLIGIGAILSMREHHGHAAPTAPPMAHFLRDLWGHLTTDRNFRLVVAVRLLVGSSGLSLPFYILYALDGLGLGAESIGFFTAANLAGGIGSSLLMARLNARSGTRAVVRLAAVLALISPAAALGILALAGAPGVNPHVLKYLYALVFVAMGALANGGFAGFISYLLESAPPEHRTVYVGLANTLNGVVLVLPFVGGWILKATSYGVLFAVTAALLALGLGGSLLLAEPRIVGAATVAQQAVEPRSEL